MLSPISGAHLNPVVSIASAFEGLLSWRDVPAYVAVQTGGAIVGVALANLMFDEPVFRASHQVRQGPGQLLSESVATFGLLATIWACSRRRPAAVPGAVAAYIIAAYWFTASTSFANPAVTLARSMTDTFAGIRPADVPLFVAAQAVGAAIATLLCRWLVPAHPEAKADA
jgi:glycerol uptake facilitator-like aquaporin